MIKKFCLLALLISALIFAISTSGGENLKNNPVEQSMTQLEQKKFEFQMQLEYEKLSLERYKALVTGISLGLPLLLGLFTLVWQGNQRREDSRDAFDLKAAEIMFSDDSPVATKNRAHALRKLFPGRFSDDFGLDFEPSQFAGPRFEAKLEVFKSACEKVTSPSEVYIIWHSIFPGDNWIKPLVENSEAIDAERLKKILESEISKDSKKPMTYKI